MGLKHILLVMVSLLALLFAGCSYYGGEQAQQPVSQPISGSTIEVTSSGFSPNSITINSGDTVTWINKDSAPHWPASAMHPTHLLYPETGGCIGSKFDACGEIPPGGSWSFTFSQKGEWKYHDHINPGSMFGTVIVN
ncbi:MAG TPA: plastocyanin/azurin family copper-binding protein [Candidatus Nanoarchaeia archaeon]|nr:plastocyanin/azurin family copper-binding protein [Candidatus Nanoarchaeia archaeon]